MLDLVIRVKLFTHFVFKNSAQQKGGWGYKRQIED
jgi:hypothetical protein